VSADFSTHWRHIVILGDALPPPYSTPNLSMTVALPLSAARWKKSLLVVLGTKAIFEARATSLKFYRR
jgi:hypothetical protein